MNFYDARLKGIKITNSTDLFVWLAFGNSASGRDTTDGTSYDSTSGYLGGLFFNTKLDKRGFNQFSIQYGKSLLKGLNFLGDAFQTEGTTAYEEQKDAHRTRVVNHYIQDLSAKLTLNMQASYEHYNNGKADETQNHETGWSIGILPQYKFTKHYHILGLIGHRVKDSDGSSKDINKIHNCSTGKY